LSVEILKQVGNKMNELKVFTLEEANSLLPALSDLIAKLQKKKAEVGQFEVQIDALELITPNGTSETNYEMNALVEKHHALVADFYSIVDDIHSHKCFLKDIDLGLIDFYGSVDGRIIYFCWHYGEERVNYWHEIGQGYTHRQPIEEL
jgi:hypothetical protein